MAAKMPSRGKRKDDISEKDEFHLPQIVSQFILSERCPRHALANSSYPAAFGSFINDKACVT